jgi:hypothetical protein
MSQPVTTYTGPLGSTLHVLRADAETVAALAAVDWNRHFSLVCLDPIRGLITLMSASHLHGLLSGMLDDVVDTAGSILAGASRGLRHSRLRGRDEPPGTGMEPDGSFYLGERVSGYVAALAEGDQAADTFFERTPPDLVYEVELMDADKGRIERYAELGVRELWLLHGRKDTWEFRAEFLSLGSGSAPRKLDTSEVLEGFTPEDVYEAEAGLRLSPTLADRMEVVNRIARRRGGDSARVHESAAACDRAIESMRALRREVLDGIDGIDESRADRNADDWSGFLADGPLH